MIRKATADDISAITKLYDEIHSREEAGETTTGWLRDVYPVPQTAVDSVKRGDMFVQEDADGQIIGTAIINQIQVDVYSEGEWNYPAKDEEIMVLHTLIISGTVKRTGLGGEFLAFYEDYALRHGCRYLRLDTNARNAVARAFYKSHGYDEIGIVPTVFNGIPGVDLVLLEKRL